MGLVTPFELFHRSRTLPELLYYQELRTWSIGANLKGKTESSIHTARH